MPANFGCQNMSDPLRRVLVKRPDEAFAVEDFERWHYTAPPDLEAAQREHEALVETVRGFDPRRLDEKQGNSDYRYVDLILGVVTHDIYHTGQIQLMKRLYREANR